MRNGFLPFVFGLGVGIVFYLWKRYQFNRRLEKILALLPDPKEDSASLSMLSRLRREMNRAYQQSQQLQGELEVWQQQLNAAPIGYLQVDAENHLLFCNQTARQWLNLDRWQPGQLRLLLEVVRSYELDQLIETTRHLQQPQTQEWVFHHTTYNLEETLGDNLSYAIPLKALSLPLPQGKVGVFIENQEQLQKLARSRDRLTSDLTHELRTPLTSIHLVAETLSYRLSPPESRWVQQMLQETDRLVHLIQDWLELSQFQENPYQSLKLEIVELSPLILSAWQTVDPIAQQKKVTLVYSNPEEIYLEADPLRLTQVLLNLFDNSIKHSPYKNVVRVDTKIVSADKSGDNDIIQIDIIDSGLGFAEADLPHVFDRLYRGDPSRARQQDDSNYRHGSGLGLSIVEQIITAHGGLIEARNHPETGGAWLQIKLPLNS